jgi:hypothetical protein
MVSERETKKIPATSAEGHGGSQFLMNTILMEERGFKP